MSGREGEREGGEKEREGEREREGGRGGGGGCSFDKLLCLIQRVDNTDSKHATIQKTSLQWQ